MLFIVGCEFTVAIRTIYVIYVRNQLEKVWTKTRYSSKMKCFSSLLRALERKDSVLSVPEGSQIRGTPAVKHDRGTTHEVPHIITLGI